MSHKSKKRNARLKRAERIVKEFWDMLYGQNMEVTNWHRNGDTEPMDNFFEHNDWSLDEKE